MAIAIYARYSSDLQNPKSVDDQVKLCRRYIESHYERGIIVLPFTDEAISGTTMDRPGLQSLLDLVRKHKIEVLVFESLDRLGRNSGDIHKMYEIFKHYDTGVISVNEGVIDELKIGFKGTMNAIFIEDMVNKVKRAQLELAREGLLPAGLSYGYKVKRGIYDERGRPINGLREIVPEQAEVIRRIFGLYVEGHTAKDIAKQLNRDNIPSPSGQKWSYSSIRGVEGRGTGILANNLYRGKLIYNKTKKVRNPETGAARNVVRPRSEWIEKDLPELAIVDKNLWHQAEAMRLSSSKEERRKYKQRNKKEKLERLSVHSTTSKRPLTGFVFCGACGGQSILRDRDRYVCKTWKNYRSCDNSRGMLSIKIIETIFDRLEKHVLENDWYDIFSGAFELERESYDNSREELKILDTKIEGMIEVIDRGINLDKIVSRLERLQIERAELEAELSKERSSLGVSNEYIQVMFLSEFRKMKEVVLSPDQVSAWRRLLSLVIDKVITTPILSKDRGMTIEVKIGSIEGWAEFYRRITAKKANG